MNMRPILFGMHALEGFKMIPNTWRCHLTNFLQYLTKKTLGEPGCIRRLPPPVPCKDKTPDCSRFGNVCTDPKFTSYALGNCAKHCNLCSKLNPPRKWYQMQQTISVYSLVKTSILHMAAHWIYSSLFKFGRLVNYNWINQMFCVLSYYPATDHSYNANHTHNNEGTYKATNNYTTSKTHTICAMWSRMLRRKEGLWRLR